MESNTAISNNIDEHMRAYEIGQKIKERMYQGDTSMIIPLDTIFAEKMADILERDYGCKIEIDDLGHDRCLFRVRWDERKIKARSAEIMKKLLSGDDDIFK